MESALYDIYALVVFVSEMTSLVRFLIRQQPLRKYRRRALSMKYFTHTCGKYVTHHKYYASKSNKVKEIAQRVESND